MRLGKKDVIIIFISFCLLISSGVNILLSFQTWSPTIVPPELETLIVGTDSGPHDLDPTDCLDSSSRDVIEQVVETLFTYDTRQYVVDETMPRINWLATGYSWDVTNTILTVDIRSGVYFHDGTLMTAHAVAWSFNRFLYLMNHTGELPRDGRAVKVHYIYEFDPYGYSPYGYSFQGTPIFNTIVASDADTVVFTLNAPYAPILDAMCYISCGILSPTSTPATEIIDLRTGDIVGTGPYMYDYYITDTEVRFTRFDDYWGTPLMEDEVMFDAMVYSVIDDPSALNYAMLAGDIDIIFGAMTNLLPAFRANPWIHVEEMDNPGLVYQYLCFNIRQINLTWRTAMSYAINYTYILEVLLDGRAFRAYGMVSPGYGNSFNHWLRDEADPLNRTAGYNLTIARQTILDGLGGDARLIGLTANSDPNDTAWEALGNSPLNCLEYFNYSYRTDSWFSSALYPLLEDWFDNIGILLEDGGVNWWEWYRLIGIYSGIPGGYDQLQLYFKSWIPDYLDPFNMIDPLFSNVSVLNTAQVNDPQIQAWLSLALQTTDDAARTKIYWDIQYRIYVTLRVHAPLYHPVITSVHAPDLYDIEYDVMGKWWALPVKRNFTWYPVIQ